MTRHQAKPLRVYSTHGKAGASARVRVYDWLDHLGISADVDNYLGLSDVRPKTLLANPIAALKAEAKLRLDRHPNDCIALVSREVSPFSAGALEARVLDAAAYGVFDIDDALFNDSEGWRKLLGKRQKVESAARHAQVVIAGNTYLADWASNHNPNVVIVPSCVRPSDYIQKHDWRFRDRPVLVWMGSPATEYYLESIAAALREIHKKTGALLYVISGPRDREHPDLANFVKRFEWSTADWRLLLSRADVAIGPLNGDAYSQGKCAYKLLQYGAAALPIVASPVAANATVVAQFDGLAATNHDEWVDAMMLLLSESEERRRLRGLRARAAVESKYSFAAWETVWVRAVGLGS